MAMQTDVKTTKVLTSTGVFKTQADQNMSFRTRIKGIYYTNGASAGTLTISDGQGGTTLISLNTPAAANADGVYFLVPDQGILAETGLYGTLTNVASVVLFYG